MGNEPDTRLGRLLLAHLRSIGATSDDDDEEEEEEEEEEEGKSGKGDEDTEVKRLRAEAKRRRLEAKDWKKRHDDLDTRLKELEAKDQTDLERTTTERDDLKTRVPKLEEQLKEAQQRLAFFESGVAAKFHNPAHALKLMDLKDLDPEADADDIASAIGEKAEALLKESPYLKVAAGGSDGGENGNGSGDSGETQDTTGAGQARGKPGKNKPADNAALLKRFPGLAGRIDVGTQQQS